MKNLKNQNKGRIVFRVLAVLLAVVLFLYIFLRSIYVVPVIMYHKIDDNWRESKLSVSPESFDRQMRFLRKNNYNIVSLDNLVELMKSKNPIPYKTIAVTFDDGYKDNYTDAFPVLKKYNIPASIFVVINKIGIPGYLNYQELEEMAENNIDIGSHTLSECYLPDIEDENKLRNEVSGSREILKSRIPGAGNFIAYCGGGFNSRVRDMVIESGYKGACATNPGKDYPDDDIYAIKRVRISRTSDNLFVFWTETSGFYTWIKEMRDD